LSFVSQRALFMQDPTRVNNLSGVQVADGAGSLFGFDLSPAETLGTPAAVPSRWQDEPRHAQQAAALQSVAKRELEAEKHRGSSSLVARIFSSPKKVKNTASLAGTPLLELRQVFQENNPESLSRSLLRLAERYAYDRKYPELTAALLEAAEKQPSVAGEVQELRAVMSGGGALLRQLRYEGTHLWNELTSPIALASFGTAVWSARLASAWVVGGSAGYGVGTWALSEAAALAVEVPAMVLSRRVGLATFVGGENLFSPELIGQELLASYGPFAMLRGGSNLFALSAPWLKAAYGLEGAGGKALLGTTRFGFELGGVLAGHGFNGFAGIENPLPLTDNAVFSALLTVVHMRAAGMALNGLRRYGAPADVAAEKRAKWAAELHRRGTEWLDGLGSMGDFLSGRRLGYAGIGGGLLDPAALRWFSKAEGSDPKASDPAAAEGKSAETLDVAALRQESAEARVTPDTFVPPDGWAFMLDPAKARQHVIDFVRTWSRGSDEWQGMAPNTQELTRSLQQLPDYFVEYLAVEIAREPLNAKLLLIHFDLVPQQVFMQWHLAPQNRGLMGLVPAKVVFKGMALDAMVGQMISSYNGFGLHFYPEVFSSRISPLDLKLADAKLRSLPAVLLETMTGLYAQGSPSLYFYLFHRLGLSPFPPPPGTLHMPNEWWWNDSNRPGSQGPVTPKDSRRKK
jgi:hypothetical protein